MKKVLLAGAGTLALVMAASAAQAQDISTGYVGATYSNIDTLNSDIKVMSVDGTIAFDVAESFEIQVDGNYSSINPPGSGSSSIWGPTAHAFLDRGNLKVGVFAGYQDLDDTFGSDSTATGYGLEGRFAVSDNVTLGAVAAWGTINVDGQPDIDLTSYSGQLSVFASDNLRFDASYTNTTADWGPFSGDTDVVALGAEWKLADSPVSFTLGYSTANSQLSGGDADTWSLGVRYVIGGNLRDRDRTSSPFLGLPFNLGGLAGIIAAQHSMYENLIACAFYYSGSSPTAVSSGSSSGGSCPDSSHVNDFFDSFDDENINDLEATLYCLLYGECEEDED